MSARTFLIEIPVVRREFIVWPRAPRVGEWISSRHPGFFDAEPSDEPAPEPFYSLQRTMWLIGRSAKWLADRVSEGRLQAYRHDDEIVFSSDELMRVLGEELPDEDEFCCRVESIDDEAQSDIDAVIHTRALPAEARWEDRRQLCFQL